MIVVVIPVFNEEKNISNVINRVSNFCDKIIVVNDASTDLTESILEDYISDKLIVIKNQKNLGIGGATKVGIAKALEINAEYIIKFDGDGQHSPEDIPEFINYLKNDNFDFVKGNRFKSSISDMPFIKLLGNLISTNLQKIVTGNFRISDPNNGFITFKANLFQKNYYQRIKENIKIIKKLPKIKGVKEIMYPGQNKYKRFKENSKKEINIPEIIKKDLEILLN